MDTTSVRADRERLFGPLATPETTVRGTHPIAGRFVGQQAFTAATFDRPAPLLREGPRFELTHLFCDGPTVVVRNEQVRARTAPAGRP